MVSNELKILLAFLASYFSAMFVIPKLANIARSIGLIDRPGEKRKMHSVPRPLVGGIGIVIAATFSSMLFVDLAGFRGLFLGLAILLFVGFLDDFRELGSRSKFFFQILASILLMYFSKTFLLSFGDLLGLGLIEVPDFDVLIWLVTIFCVVGVINSINLIDGLDGLAGGVSFIAFLTFALHASFGGETVMALINLAFAGAVMGFLRYNWHPAVVFMGDAGSLCLGFALSFMAIALSQGEKACISPVVPLLVLAVPITDTVTVMTKRVLKRSNPFRADHYHLHHIFMRYGMGRETVVKVILGICIAMCGVTILASFYDIPDYWLFLIYAVYLACYFTASFFILFTMRQSLRFKKRREVNGYHEDRATSFARALLDKMDKLRIFRKDVRYKLELETHLLVSDDVILPCILKNISNRGCMLFSFGLDKLHQQVILELVVPIDNDMLSLSLKAEHLWMAEAKGGYFSGFRFLDMDKENQLLFESFMDRVKRHSIFALN